MDMPTPCQQCGDIVEFNDMEKLNGNFICSDCADQCRCELCDCIGDDVKPTCYGHLCGDCERECKDSEEDWVD